MKIKLTTLLIVLVLLVIGGLGAYFLIKNKDIGVMKSTKNDNGIGIMKNNNTTPVENESAKNNQIINEENNENIKISSQSFEERTKAVNNYINQGDEYGMEEVGIPNGRFISGASLNKEDDIYVMKLKIASPVIFDKTEVENAVKLAKENGKYKFNKYTFYKNFDEFKSDIESSVETQYIENMDEYNSLLLKNQEYLVRDDHILDYPFSSFVKTPKNPNKYYVKNLVPAGSGEFVETIIEKELYVNLLPSDKLTISPINGEKVEFSVKEFYENCENNIVSSNPNIDGFIFDKTNIGDTYGSYGEYINAVYFENDKLIIHYKNGRI